MTASPEKFKAVVDLLEYHRQAKTEFLVYRSNIVDGALSMDLANVRVTAKLARAIDGTGGLEFLRLSHRALAHRINNGVLALTESAALADLELRLRLEKERALDRVERVRSELAMVRRLRKTWPTAEGAAGNVAEGGLP